MIMSTIKIKTTVGSDTRSSCGKKIQKKLYKSTKAGVLLGMSTKSLLLIALALVAMFVFVAMLLPAFPPAKKHASRDSSGEFPSRYFVQAENSALTNSVVTNGVMILKANAEDQAYHGSIIVTNTTPTPVLRFSMPTDGRWTITKALATNVSPGSNR